MKVNKIEVRDIEALNGGFIRDKRVAKTLRYEIIEGRLYLDEEHSTKATIKISGRNPGWVIDIEDNEEIREEFKKIEEKARKRAAERNKAKLIYLLTAIIIAVIMTVPAILSRQAGTLTRIKLIQTITAGAILETVLYLMIHRKERII